MCKLFPNGFGSRAFIACAVVATFCAVAAMQDSLDPLKEVALMVVAFYFGQKGGNGRHGTS